MQLVIAFFLFAMTMALLPLAAARAEAPAVLILETSDTSKSPLSQALYMDVISRIANQVEKAGFVALRSSGESDMSAARSEAEENSDIIEQAKSAQGEQKIAFAAVIRLFADMVLLTEGTQIKLGIKGRLLDVGSGDILARFDLKLPENYQAPPSCNRRCLIQMLQSNAAGIADSLGQILGQRLNERQENTAD